MNQIIDKVTYLEEKYQKFGSKELNSKQDGVWKENFHMIENMNDVC